MASGYGGLRIVLLPPCALCAFHPFVATGRIALQSSPLMLAQTDAYVGQAAGLATSLLWTATSLFFDAASRRIGPVAVNSFRIVMAVVLLGLTHRLWTGQWIPDALLGQYAYLALSGFVGLSLGDQALFSAFVRIGPRRSMLVMTTSPLFAAFFGWLALDETLPLVSWLGVLLTTGGVAWVVLERPRLTSGESAEGSIKGVLLALVAAACQGGGLLLSKKGMGHGWLDANQHLDPQAATLVRMFFAAIGVIPILAVHALRSRKARVIAPTAWQGHSALRGYIMAGCGSVTGPFLGVWMSLVASDLAPLGVAQTLCSMAPLFLLPFAALMYKERIGRRAIIGALAAIAGSAVLVIRPN